MISGNCMAVKARSLKRRLAPLFWREAFSSPKFEIDQFFLVVAARAIVPVHLWICRELGPAYTPQLEATSWNVVKFANLEASIVGCWFR